MKGMSDAEIQRYIRQEIDRRLNIILPGVSGNATGQQEDMGNVYPGQAPIPARPTARPYGFISRAPKGTPQVTGRMGSHPANRLVLGHRDPSAPSLPDEGDSGIYSLGAQLLALRDRIRLAVTDGFFMELQQGQQEIGKVGGYSLVITETDITGGKTPKETLVAGETLIELLSQIIDVLVTHNHITSAPGAPTSPMVQAANLQALKVSYLTTPLILMKDGGRY